MISIRKYQDKDKEYLREICIKTSALPIDTETDRRFLYLMYNDYYTEVEGRNCFVAVDENEDVLGYCFCIHQQYLNNNILTDIKTLYIDDFCVEFFHFFASLIS